MRDGKDSERKRVRSEQWVKDILPSVCVKKQSLSSQKPLSCVIITHWLTQENPENSSLFEVVEFVWAVYDLQSNSILEKTRHIVQPTELCFKAIPSSTLAMLKIEDYHCFEKAKTLPDVLLELSTAVALMHCRGVCIISGCNKLQNELLGEIFRKKICVPDCLKHFLDLSKLLLQFYPKFFANVNAFYLSPSIMAERLQMKLPEMALESYCMYDCLIVCHILKKITLDSFYLQEENVSTLVTHPVTPVKQEDMCVSLCNKNFESNDSLFIRLRGVPWGISKNDIVQFIQPVCSVATSNIYIGTNKNGKISGEVYVKLKTEFERDQCVHELHRRYIGSRWIEVFKASTLDLHQISMLGDSPYDKWGAVRLRGLPWSIHESDIVKFFAEAGLCISACCVILGKNHQGHLNGDAWVVLATIQHAENAKQLLDKKMLKKRYIEVFLSTIREVQMALHEPFLKSHSLALHQNKTPSFLPQDLFNPLCLTNQTNYTPAKTSPTLTKEMVKSSTCLHNDKIVLPRKVESPVLFHEYHSIPKVQQSNFLRSSVLRMRGLPYHATQKNILNFFNGFGIVSILPTTGLINNKPSGEAYAEFTTVQEAWKAFTCKNGALMEHRYIELFFAKKQEMQAALLKLFDALQDKKKYSSHNVS